MIPIQTALLCPYPAWFPGVPGEHPLVPQPTFRAQQGLFSQSFPRHSPLRTRGQLHLLPFLPNTLSDPRLSYMATWTRRGAHLSNSALSSGLPIPFASDYPLGGSTCPSQWLSNPLVKWRLTYLPAFPTAPYWGASATFLQVDCSNHPHLLYTPPETSGQSPYLNSSTSSSASPARMFPK